MISSPEHAFQWNSLFLFLSFLLIFGCSAKQDKLTSTLILDELTNLSEIQDATTRTRKTDALWDSLKTSNRIPFTQDSTVIFLYRGDAEAVSWNGDFNSWSDNKNFPNKGTLVDGTDLWYLQTAFPSDARIDYKITLNNDEWILDPNNSHQQWSGFGPNSELRMPDWKPDPATEKNPAISTGSLSGYKTIDSKPLRYKVQYKVYTPSDYESMENLPVIYITDGQEYADDRLGSSVITLDNLIDQDKIEPVIAVFVDPLNPNDLSENRRADEFALNPDYLAFFEKELIPTIDENYKTESSPEARAILGTSLGGLNATYFGFSRPDLFSMMGIQAPAYWFNENIYDIVRQSNVKSPNIFMSVGTIGDNLNEARQMKKILEEKKLNLTYTEVNEGHSWGAWRTQVDDILIQFFGK